MAYNNRDYSVPDTVPSPTTDFKNTSVLILYSYDMPKDQIVLSPDGGKIFSPFPGRIILYGGSSKLIAKFQCQKSNILCNSLNCK